MALSVDLSGRRVLVTGASSGIGEATCRALVGFGASVAMLARRQDRLDALAEQLGPTAVPVAADVTDLENLKASVAAAADRLEGLDGVVAVAGQNISGSMMAGSPELWRKVIDVNMVGPLATLRYASDHLVADGRRDLMLIGSAGGLLGVAGLGIYGATKRGLRAAAESLRLELAPHNINVSLLIPGLFLTEGTVGDLVHRDGERIPMDLPVLVEGTIPPGPEAVADTIAYMLSLPDGVCINEAVIRPTGNLFP